MPSRGRFIQNPSNSNNAASNNNIRTKNDPYTSQPKSNERNTSSSSSSSSSQSNSRSSSRFRSTLSNFKPTEPTTATKPTKRNIVDSLNDVKPNVTPFPSRISGVRDLVRLTEPTINITHNGSTKVKESQEVVDYKDQAPLEDESKFYNSPRNNVEKDQGEGEVDDFDASQEVVKEPTKEIEAHTVILTDNFFLPGQNEAKSGEKEEDTEEPEYEYEYEYVDDTEEPPTESVNENKDTLKEKQDVELVTTFQPRSLPTTTLPPKVASSETTDSVTEYFSEERSLPTTTQPEVTSTKSVANTTLETPPLEHDQEEEPGNTTESWVVVASVQTSRSVSGARFLPFQVTQEEKKAPITELDNIAKQSDEKTSKEQISSKTSESDTIDDSDVVTDNPKPSLPKESEEEHELELETDKPESQVTEINHPTGTSSPPVVIRKFSPRTTTPKAPRVFTTTTSTASPVTTTEQPTKKDNKIMVQDDLAGLLPADFKPRYIGYKKKTTPTTTTATKTESTTEDSSSLKSRNINNTRSFFKNDAPAQDVFPDEIKSKIKFISEDIGKFLPKDYTTEAPKVIAIDDVSKFLPPGYKPPVPEVIKIKPPSVIPLKDEISKFLPPGYKAPAEEVQSTTKKYATTNDDVSKFLPPGYKFKPEKPEVKSTTTKSPKVKVEDEPKKVDDDLLSNILKKVQFKEVSDLLPPDFKPTTEEPENYPSTTAKGFGPVFPTRPGGNKEAGLPSYKRPKGPPPPKIEVRKGPPTR